MTSSTKQVCYEQFTKFVRESFSSSFDGKLRFVTNNEKCLYNAFLKVFPEALHALCAIHSRRTVKRKLKIFTGENAGISEKISSHQLGFTWWFTRRFTRYFISLLLVQNPVIWSSRYWKRQTTHDPDRHIRQGG